jgi:hypothetical protein
MITRQMYSANFINFVMAASLWLPNYSTQWAVWLLATVSLALTIVHPEILR